MLFSTVSVCCTWWRVHSIFFNLLLKDLFTELSEFLTVWDLTHLLRGHSYLMYMILDFEILSPYRPMVIYHSLSFTVFLRGKKVVASRLPQREDQEAYEIALVDDLEVAIWGETDHWQLIPSPERMELAREAGFSP